MANIAMQTAYATRTPAAKDARTAHTSITELPMEPNPSTFKSCKKIVQKSPLTCVAEFILARVQRIPNTYFVRGR
jgi:hypothetical protein